MRPAARAVSHPPGDLWVRILALAVRVVFWFDPLAWRLGRQVVEWSELACDEAVTAALGRGSGGSMDR